MGPWIETAFPVAQCCMRKCIAHSLLRASSILWLIHRHREPATQFPILPLQCEVRSIETLSRKLTSSYDFLLKYGKSEPPLRDLIAAWMSSPLSDMIRKSGLSTVSLELNKLFLVCSTA